MILPAAKELQKRDQENKKLKQNLSYTRTALYIAASALVIDTIIRIIKIFYPISKNELLFLN
jgi:hypothetical protein